MAVSRTQQNRRREARWTAYPAYKDSGVPWLGDIPEGWEATKFKRCLDLVTSGSRGWAGFYSDDGDVFIRIGNLTRDTVQLDMSDVQHVAVPPNAEGARTRVRGGDLLVSITADLGSVAIVPDKMEAAYVSQHVALARPSPNANCSLWLAYSILCDCARFQLRASGYGGTKIQLALDDVKNLTIPLPPVSEQRAIAAFLDRETGRIDALIAKKERQIELLREKRQALISALVTGQLSIVKDPDTGKLRAVDDDQLAAIKADDPSRVLVDCSARKPSGIPWLGDVPEGWEVVRNRRLLTRIEQGYSPPVDNVIEDDDDCSVITLSAVKSGRFDTTATRPIRREHFRPEYELKPGDFLLTRGNTPELVADVCLVGKDIQSRTMLSDLVYRLQYSRAGTDLRFIVAWFLSTPARHQINSCARGSSTSMIKVAQEHIREWVVPLPRLSEQQAIVEVLDEQLGRASVLSQQLRLSIDTLCEYRAALISAAVTGKIDVREQ
jgi:type I restriction enzyme, S subunit